MHTHLFISVSYISLSSYRASGFYIILRKVFHTSRLKYIINIQYTHTDTHMYIVIPQNTWGICSKTPACTHTWGICSKTSACTQIHTYSSPTVSPPYINRFHIPRILYFQLEFGLKKSVYKWTHVVQTWVVQGSTLYSPVIYFSTFMVPLITIKPLIHVDFVLVKSVN